MVSKKQKDAVCDATTVEDSYYAGPQKNLQANQF